MLLKRGKSLVSEDRCGGGKTLPALLFPRILDDDDHARALALAEEKR
jgi:hypothetical protein